MGVDGGLRIEAPAKVNLGLHVLARRGDGFHEIDTLMCKLELTDTLVMRPVPGGVSGGVSGDGSGGVRGTVVMPSGPGFAEELAMDEENLVVRAIRSYLEAIGQAGGVEVELQKRIPVAAGLGGGSSDAAAALWGVARLYPASVDLAGLALGIGSDVPFFLQGSPAARARGRGEKLTPVTVPSLSLVLVNPGTPVSAADAYARLQNFTPRLDPEAIVARLENGEEPGWRNALQPGVMLEFPEIRDALMALRDHDLRGVTMSGSGATCFGVAKDDREAERIAAELRDRQPGWWARATRTRAADATR